MKKFLLIAFLVSIEQSFAQDCKSLNNFNSFHGIKFGQYLADSVKKYFKFEMLNGNYDSSSIDYSLDQKILEKDNGIFEKFYKWFHFGGSIFSEFTVECLPDGRVFKIDLTRYYKKNDFASREDSIEIINKKLPKTFINASDEVTSLFGQMSRTESENDILGHNLYRIWDCEKTKIVLNLVHSDSEPPLKMYVLIIELSFIDKELEKIHKLYKYQN